MREVASGNVVYFDDAQAGAALELIEKQREDGTVTPEAFERKQQEIADDI